MVCLCGEQVPPGWAYANRRTPLNPIFRFFGNTTCITNAFIMFFGWFEIQMIPKGKYNPKLYTFIVIFQNNIYLFHGPPYPQMVENVCFLSLTTQCGRNWSAKMCQKDHYGAQGGIGPGSMPCRCPRGKILFWRKHPCV